MTAENEYAARCRAQTEADIAAGAVAIEQVRARRAAKEEAKQAEHRRYAEQLAQHTKHPVGAAGFRRARWVEGMVE